jgi:copper(I)-binding protein
MGRGFLGRGTLFWALGLILGFFQEKGNAVPKGGASPWDSVSSRTVSPGPVFKLGLSAGGGARSPLKAIGVEGAFCRALKGAANGAAYMTLRLPQADVLRGVVFGKGQRVVAKSLEMHVHTSCSAASGMKAVDRLDAPGGVLALQPGGAHIMLMDLQEPLSEGEVLVLTLTFERAGEVTVRLPVRTTLDWQKAVQQGRNPQAALKERVLESGGAERPQRAGCGCQRGEP